MIWMKGERANSSLLQEEREGIHMCVFWLYLLFLIALIQTKVKNWKHLDLHEHLDFLASICVGLCYVSNREKKFMICISYLYVDL
jgi:hypothetical protein